MNKSPQPTPVTPTDTLQVSGAGYSAVNNTYYLAAGTAGTTNAQYIDNSVCYTIKYYSNCNKWVIYDSSLPGSEEGYYKADSITGTWQLIEAEGDETGLPGVGTTPAPTVTYI